MPYPIANQLNELITKDLQHIWHPCSQMHDYEDFPPIVVDSAKGSYLYLADGSKVIDAISSWWCKSLGHNHPVLKAALLKQLDKFEHVLLANTTNTVITELSAKLATLMPHLTRVFYASDGSCAVEIAMKMSLQARQLQQSIEHIAVQQASASVQQASASVQQASASVQQASASVQQASVTMQVPRTGFLALENSYHGETILALAASDLGIYKKPFTAILPKIDFLTGFPYVSSMHDPLWHNCSSYWPNILRQLEALKYTLTAIIVEPIVQGAGGMLIYSADFLQRLATWAQNNDIHLIADEIMTGFGRTGLPLACQHANIKPDFICIAKGLTSGWLPLSAVLTTDAIYQLFYDDHATGKAFLHSHTHSGNALAASVALACLQVMEQENIYAIAQQRGALMLQLMQQIALTTGKLQNIRSIGAIVAADLIIPPQHPPESRLGFMVYKAAMARGALLRPLGNTIYWLPPLNVPLETLYELQAITKQAITDVYAILS